MSKKDLQHYRWCGNISLKNTNVCSGLEFLTFCLIHNTDVSFCCDRIYENLPEVRRRREEERRKAEYQSYRLNARLYNKVARAAFSSRNLWLKADRFLPFLALTLWNISPWVKWLTGCFSLDISENQEPSTGQENSLELIKQTTPPSYDLVPESGEIYWTLQHKTEHTQFYELISVYFLSCKTETWTMCCFFIKVIL